MKRIISVFMAITLMLSALCALSFNALALETDDGFEYEILDDNTIRITGYKGTADPVNIPDVIVGKNVTEIGDLAFISNTNISEVRLSKNVKSIGMAAFYGCAYLTEIELSGSLETIGADAFTNCNKLKEITVPEDNDTFRSLNGVLFSKDLSKLILYPVNYQDKAYGVPSAVKTIEKNAFNYAAKLETIFISKGLEKIEENAFENADKLSKIRFSGTQAEWNAIDIDSTGNAGFKALPVETEAQYCEEGVKGEVEVNTDSTCAVAGVCEFYCKECGDYKSEVKEKKDHVVIDDKAVAATYFATGKTAGSHCDICKEVFKKQETVAKLVLAVPTKFKVKAVKKGFKATYAKNANATGYQVQYSTSKKFAKKKTKTKNIAKNSTLKYTFKNKKLKKQKKYYVRVRAYVKSGNQTAYSNWSKTKTVKTK